MKNIFTKKNVLTFLGALGAALVSTIVSRIQTKNDIAETVKAVLAEERRQMSDEACKEDVEEVNS